MFGSLLFVLLWGSGVAYTEYTLDEQWDLWMKMHGKLYLHKIEEFGRRRVWEENLKMINLHNLEASMGMHTYDLAMNHMGDLTLEEISSTLSNIRVPTDLERGSSTFTRMPVISVPLSLDWREKGLVSEVKLQGSCGSCWAFSAVGALEGQLKKTTGTLVNLSPQNLVDCSGTYGNYGCNGGFMTNAFKYVVKNQGIASEAAYPYVGKEGGCKYETEHRAANCTGYEFLPKGDEEALKEGLAVIGPISAAIDGSRPKFVFYHQGIYNDRTCKRKVNHAVLVVGYGSVDGQDYWLVKNSWGVYFGDRGYVKMARNEDNQCGIALYPCYPIM
ncbi:cathepsin S-like [Hypomesus transpacificus]|uniref:cathepsin S-like n=1 Tax=Hypomesus transpacificus TaxID=137520 RepID=UPI001F07AEA7|nr:cathepsin S-like [Hypomesus transpacificus]